MPYQPPRRLVCVSTQQLVSRPAPPEHQRSPARRASAPPRCQSAAPPPKQRRACAPWCTAAGIAAGPSPAAAPKLGAAASAAAAGQSGARLWRAVPHGQPAVRGRARRVVAQSAGAPHPTALRLFYCYTTAVIKYTHIHTYTHRHIFNTYTHAHLLLHSTR